LVARPLSRCHVLLFDLVHRKTVGAMSARFRADFVQ
jgi:hypothetical protein